MTDEIIGNSIGRYHVLDQIGKGGMATVYKAFDTRLERDVAIKLLRTERLDSRKAIKRFEIEAKALAQLNHPNIVQVMDYGEHDGMPYLDDGVRSRWYAQGASWKACALAARRQAAGANCPRPGLRP